MKELIAKNWLQITVLAAVLYILMLVAPFCTAIGVSILVIAKVDISEYVTRSIEAVRKKEATAKKETVVEAEVVKEATTEAPKDASNTGV